MSNETPTLLDDDIPAKFKDPDTGEVRVDALVQSYKELEKKMSSKDPGPKSPDEYCIDCSHGMFEPDAEINQRLFDKGMTNEQVQEVYNLAKEKMVPMVRDINREYQADREIEKLINHYGGSEQWKEVARQLLAFGQKNLPADVLDNLSSSFEGVLALERMMKSGEPGLKKSATAASGSMDETELQSMMRDPKYWRDKDPAFVAKVTQGFQTIYGA